MNFYITLSLIIIILTILISLGIYIFIQYMDFKMAQRDEKYDIENEDS